MQKLLLTAALAAVAVTFVAPGAESETLTFFGNGAWTNGQLWYRLTGNAYTVANKVPDSTDDAVIGAGAVCDASAGGLHSVVSLTILLTSTLNNGQFDATTYSFVINSAPGSGSTLTVNGANFNVRSSGAMNFNVSNVYINNSTITFQGGSFASVTIGPNFSGTTIFNEGSFVIQGGAAVTFAGGNSRFDNLGDIRGNGGTTQLIGGSFLTINNSGTISAESGSTLFINGNLTWEEQDGSGSFFAVTSDAVINITGAFTVPANTITYFKGPGVINTLGNVIINGTLEVGVPASGPIRTRDIHALVEPAQPGTWNFARNPGTNADLNGAGWIMIDTLGVMNIKTSIQGAFTGMVANHGQLNFIGSNDNGTESITVDSGVFDNFGTIRINLRELDTSNATFTNELSGTINFQAPTGIVGDGLPRSIFNNLGTWNGIGGTSSNPPAGFSGPIFNNDGALNITGTGGFQIFAGQGGGTFNVPDGLALTFVANTYKFTSGAQITGPGDVVVANSGGLYIDTNLALANLILGLSQSPNGVIDGPGTLSVSNHFTWNGGTIQGGGSLNFDMSCLTLITGSATKVLDQRTINNAGTISWTGFGTVQASNGATLNNLNGSLYDVQNDYLLSGSIDNTPTFNNQSGATFRKSSGTGTTTIGINFNNSGLVDLQTGTTTFYNFHQLAGGTTKLNGGNLGNVGGTPITYDGGTLFGSGTITGQCQNHGATINPGFSPGKITINGDFIQDSGGTLRIEIAGLTTPGVDYDLLEITGTATLGGALRVFDINGFTPSGTDTVTPLTAGSITGTFSSTNAQVNYGATSITVAALPSPLSQLLNISTRLRVLTDENVLIGGFIITGADAKTVIIRGLGPSLTSQGVPGALQDPTLELHQGNTTIATNDNWKDTQEQAINASTIPPTNDLESAIVATLNPGAYTAILAGKNGGTGVGLVEVYDLSQPANSQLANISTRGFVDTGDNAMIGGMILGPNNAASSRVIVRAIGPSLQNAGVANPLQDPTLELHDGSGTTIASNDNWKDTQQSDVEATTIPPTDDRESAIVATLSPGPYTAIVRGKSDTTGVALVEVYNLQ
jgi:hypothetical protein